MIYIVKDLAPLFSRSQRNNLDILLLRCENYGNIIIDNAYFLPRLAFMLNEHLLEILITGEFQTCWLWQEVNRLYTTPCYADQSAILDWRIV